MSICEKCTHQGWYRKCEGCFYKEALPFTVSKSPSTGKVVGKDSQGRNVRLVKKGGPRK